MADQEGTRNEEPMEVDEGSEAPTTPSAEPPQAEWSDTGSPEQRQGLPLGTKRRVRPPSTDQPQTGRAEQAHTATAMDHDYAQPSGSTAIVTEPTNVQTSIDSGEGTALYSTKGTLCTPPPGFERPTGGERPAQLTTAMLVDDCDPAPAPRQDEGRTATEERGAEATPGRVGGGGGGLHCTLRRVLYAPLLLAWRPRKRQLQRKPLNPQRHDSKTRTPTQRMSKPGCFTTLRRFIK